MKNLNLVVGCIHAPFHNKKLMNGILKWASEHKNQLNGLYNLGDGIDLNSLSAHEKGKLPIPGVTLSWEYKEANKLYDDFDDAVGKGTKKRWVYGNHEDRHARTLQFVDNSKFGEALLSPIDGLRLKERGYEVKTNWKEDYFKIGDHLEAIHGIYTSKYPARKHLTELKTSCIFAHTHKMDIAIDEQQGAYNIGWLGDIHSPAFSYANRIVKKNWVNGFAIVTIDDNGDFHVQVIQAYNSRFYYNGKLY